MYVAQRELKIVDANGVVKRINPGEEVVDFDSWDIVPRRAHLNLEWVTKVEDPEPKEDLPEFEEGFHCVECPKVFKSAKALKLHDKSVHR